jgi:hypothetical protein
VETTKISHFALQKETAPSGSYKEGRVAGAAVPRVGLMLSSSNYETRFFLIEGEESDANV